MEQALVGRIVEGAVFERDGIVAFRGADARRLLREEHGLTLSLSAVYRLLHRNRLSWLVRRPRHPRVRRPGPGRGVVRRRGAGRAEEPADRLWARTGSRPTAPKDLRFAATYIFGAVCPQQRTAAALVMPVCNTVAMHHPRVRPTAVRFVWAGHGAWH